ncbi:MAG: prepilin-type N-terminal cleavage/methylation domain-containing protein, partial [Candidatus Heimdallarchaeota archaeon]|nr:prepilin-type N-terminal cleavage/methylation domain-containing protein [Candidatus Heimdallarchaeota archaeon]
MLNNRKGLTIIELAVTIVVSGIVIMPIGIIMVYITRSMIETRTQLELHQEVTRGIEFFTESAAKCDAYVIYT